MEANLYQEYLVKVDNRLEYLGYVHPTIQVDTIAQVCLLESSNSALEETLQKHRSRYVELSVHWKTKQIHPTCSLGISRKLP